MAKQTINNDTDYQVDIFEDHTNLTLVEGYNLAVSDANGIYNEHFRDAHMVINGHIDVLSEQGGYAGILTWGTGDLIEVGEKGTISGPRGIELDGDDETVVNHGSINGTNFGIRGSKSDDHVTNFGTISGGYALVMDDGADTIVNRGKIIGSLETGEGADHIDLRGGTVKGLVDGQDGNDVYLIGKNIPHIADSAGHDTLRTTASFTMKPSQGLEVVTAIGHKDVDVTGDKNGNTLGGNGGDNHISGLGGKDRLEGGAGSDILSGGLDSDSFHFRRGDDKDVVADFDAKGADHDILDLTQIKSMHSFADVESHMSLQHGDTVIDFGHGDQLTIRDIRPGDLHAQDFHLI
jgi:Ca2+-binding RTX toxin-like protein